MKKLTLFLLMLAGLQTLGQSSPERVEPPFWWAGMAHPELQIMVYAEGIGNMRAELDHPGISLRETVVLDNPDYLILYLDISEAEAGSFSIDFTDGRRTRYSYDYELMERSPEAALQQGFDASDPIYLLMPDRFANAVPENDEVEGMREGVDLGDPNARQGGDIQGIIENLDYIAGMGFGAIWINPLLENDQPRYSYHGYAITDFYNIDARFGGNDAYLRLVEEAEQRDLKIIKDMVFNHIGHHHWWMEDLPSEDWINQWDEFTRTTYRMTTITDPHASAYDYKRMMDGWFDTNMPDLNQRNPHVATYLMQNSVWWIEYAGIHGYRIDTQPYADKYFMASWGEYVMREYPNFNIVGESWTGEPAMVSYFQGGKPAGYYDSHLPSVFDFPMYDAIGLAFEEDQGWDTGMIRIYNTLALDFLYPDPYNLVVFGSNHDTDRFLTRVGDNPDKLKMALALVFTTRGIPMMYTGTELLKSALEHEGHGIMRSKFPGGWPGDETDAFTPEGRTPEQNEMVDFITNLLEWRADKEVMHYGWLRHFVPEDNIYVYFRYDDEDVVMVVLNNNESEKTLRLERYDEMTRGFSTARDIISGTTLEGFEEWVLPANGVMVMELSD